MAARAMRPDARLRIAKTAAKKAEKVYLWHKKVADQTAVVAASAKDNLDAALAKIQDIMRELDDLDRAEKAEIAKAIARRKSGEDSPEKTKWRQELEKWRNEGF